MRRVAPVLLTCAIALGACSDGGEEPAATTAPDTTPTTASASTTTTAAPTTTTSPTPPLAEARVRLTPIASVEAPTAMATRPGDDALYVAEQPGRVVAVRDGAVTPVLDLRDRVLAGGERGLLGLAFSADGRRLFVHYSQAPDGATRVVEYTMDGETANPDSGRELLAVEQPQANHNGGQLALGPDGMLWIGLGDGGGADDRGAGHVEGGNAQHLGNLLGKLLRIDPTPSGTAPYTIPADNPFAEGQGGPRPEIWAYGLRNPWRFTFDGATGDLWIGDVGQNQVEEIDFAPAPQRGRGANFGWNRFEGSRRYLGDEPPGYVPPIYDYTQADAGGCSVIVGYVVRDPRLPQLDGALLYTDYCDPTLRALREDDGAVADQASLGVEAPDVASFGQGSDGALYLLSQSNGLLRVDSA